MRTEKQSTGTANPTKSRGASPPAHIRTLPRGATFLLAGFGSVALWLGVLVGFTPPASATTICGPDISGTWAPAGNPYIIACDSTVPAGQTLTIEPGTVVWVFSNVTFTVNGLIQAIGTPAQRITLGTNDDWYRGNAIVVNGTAGTNRFEYCDFRNANTGLAINTGNKNEVSYCNFQNNETAISIYSSGGGLNRISYCNFHDGADGVTMRVYGSNTPQTNQIISCIFNNLTSRAVYGEAQGHASYTYTVPGILSAVVKNCVFYNVANGCSFKIFGEHFPIPPGPGRAAYGYAYPQIVGNLFYSVTNSALTTQVGSLPGSGTAVFINNTVISASTGVSAQDPWDATVQNCIFVSCTNATVQTGSLSLGVWCNDYYNNATNFIGYPPSYGLVLPGVPNQNGTPCDAYTNIFQNPLFMSASNFHLTATSPCIDAGNPDTNYWDACLGACGVSLGTAVNDMGAYGGPEACGWVFGCGPEIVVQPSDQKGCLGHSVTFTVSANGPGPLTYQWYSNAGEMSGETNATLTLTELKATDAGKYSVVVSNPYGSTNSSLANLTVFDACTDVAVYWYFRSYMYSGVKVGGLPGASYVLKCTSDLRNTDWSAWTPLATNTMDSSGWWFHLDTQSPHYPHRFYGAKLAP